jgi:hypothetical protein
MEALLSKVLETVGIGDTADEGSEALLPELSDTVRLPPPSEAMKQTRRRLAEIEKEELADLRDQLATANEEVAAEEAVIAEADYDVETELAKGETRESLSARKVAAQVASEILQVKLNNAEEIKAKIDTKRRELNQRSTRLMSWLAQTEVQTRAYQISLITGADRLTNEKFARAYRLLQALEKFATEMIGEKLAKEVIASITNNPIPPSLQECLLLQMPKRDRDQIESEQKGDS